MISVAIAGCGGGAEKPVAQKKAELVAPMENPTQEKIADRIKRAGALVLKYAAKHGDEFPKAETAKDLAMLLKPEFGSEPDFDALFLSRNGKTWLTYNFQIQGKKLMDIPQKSQTALLWDPLNFEKNGQCYVYVDGETKWVMRMPSVAGG